MPELLQEQSLPPPPQPIPGRNPDDILHVVFYTRPVKNNFLSKKEGRPIFDDVAFVKIQAPGNNLNIIDTPARGDHKERFPRQWAVFQNQQRTSEQERLSGTPVDEWPVLTKGQAEELKGIKFFTVEQIAYCSDAQLANLGMNGAMLRKKAIAFIESAKSSALAQSQAEDLAKKDAEIAALKKAQDALAADLEALRKAVSGDKPQTPAPAVQQAQEEPRKRGRPRTL